MNLLVGIKLSAQISAYPDTTICSGQSVLLNAVLTGGSGYGTDNYVFEEIPYSPESYDGEGVSLSDDDYDGPFDIGFDFCFIGATYDEFWVGSNGWISFGPAASLASTYVSVPIPDTDPSVPKNCIASPWEDWDPGYFGGEYIFYQTVGVAPDRKLIISWVDIPMFDCWDDASLNGTFQIVIYETTNIIENHIEYKSNCDTWYPTGTQGVHNIDGTIAYTAPGRNGTTWEAENESTRFVPSGISWYLGPTLIGYSDTLTVSPTETTTYTAVVTLCDGSTYEDDVTVTVNELNETITINDVLCNGDETGSASIDITGSEPPFSYIWSNGETDSEIDAVEAGAYTVTVEDNEGCTKTYDILITEPDAISIDPDIIDAGCFGYEDGEFTVNATGGISPYEYSLNGGAGQTSDEYDELAAGEYTITVTDDNGCIYEETFTIDEPDQIFVEAGEDQFIVQGESTSIEATASTSDITGVSWGPDGGTVPCDDGVPCLTYNVAPLYTTTYYVTITDENGCTASDSITIHVEFVPEIYFPNAFSPNGDNINDLFQGIGYNVVEYDLKIYNRWGEIIYETTDFNYTSGWDGTYNGKPVDIGSYVYQATVGFNTGDNFTSNGSFTVVR